MCIFFIVLIDLLICLKVINEKDLLGNIRSCFMFLNFWNKLKICFWFMLYMNFLFLIIRWWVGDFEIVVRLVLFLWRLLISFVCFFRVFFFVLVNFVVYDFIVFDVVILDFKFSEKILDLNSCWFFEFGVWFWFVGGICK